MPLQVLPLKYDMTFSPAKCYFLVGCLGGLGRSLAKWMLKRGARQFMFMGRSGLDNEVARSFVKGLQREGAKVMVEQGDVCEYADVERAINRIEGPIGGVVQAAMRLDVSFLKTPQWRSLKITM